MSSNEIGIWSKLARFYELQGQYAKAERLWRRELNYLQRTHGHEQQRIAQVLQKLGLMNLYLKEGIAHEYFQRAMLMLDGEPQTKQIKVNETNFAFEVNRSEKPVLAVFYSNKENPLHVSKLVASLSTNLSDLVKVVKIDVDESPNVAKTFDVAFTPSIHLINFCDLEDKPNEIMKKDPRHLRAL